MKELKIYLGFLTVVAISSAVAFTIGKQESKEKADIETVIELETALETEEITELETIIEEIGKVVDTNEVISKLETETKKEEKVEETEIESEYKADVTNTSTEDNSEELESTNSDLSQIPTEETIETSSQETETEEFDNFQTEKENLLKALTDGDVELVKKLGKEYAIIGRDFLFNGKEIKGVTFNELTEQGKEEVYDNLMIIDSWIMELDPDYKEQVKNGYEHTKNFAGKMKQKFKNWVSTWE